MELYIVRHGRTVWNAKNLLQGQTDIELDEEGIAAAKSLGIRLADTEFDCVYSSPLSRARNTAALIIGSRGIPVYTDERLKEISFGVLEGTSNIIEKQPHGSYAYFFSNPEKYTAPEGGEEFRQVIDRTGDFIREMIQPHAAENARIMIVGHGAMNAGFMSSLEKRPVENYWGDGLQKNCEATIYRFTNNSWIKIN